MGRAGKALKKVLETYGISQNQLAVTMGPGGVTTRPKPKERKDLTHLC
jgi:hypothetical protein